jgi:hypothetical protein
MQSLANAAPDGGIHSSPNTASLKRCPDTKRDWSASRVNGSSALSDGYGIKLLTSRRLRRFGLTSFSRFFRSQPYLPRTETGFREAVSMFPVENGMKRGVLTNFIRGFFDPTFWLLNLPSCSIEFAARVLWVLISSNPDIE